MLFIPELHRLWNKIFYHRQEITLWQCNPEFITATTKPTAIHDDLRIPQTTLDCWSGGSDNSVDKDVMSC